MNRSARKQHHEQLRKKHRQEQKEQAREAAQRKPSTTAAWIMGIGVALVVAILIATTAF